MFNNKYGRKVLAQNLEIEKQYIDHQDKKRTMIKGGMKKNQREYEMMSEAEIPKGNQVWGDLPLYPTVKAGKKGGNIMSGFSDGTNLDLGEEKNTKGIKGEVMPKDSKLLWGEIERAIGEGKHKPIKEAKGAKCGGNVVSSLGPDLIAMDDMTKSGGAFDKKNISKTIKTAENLIPQLDKVVQESKLLAPAVEQNKSKLETVKAVIKHTSDIIRDIAPVVKLLLELHNKRGGVAGDFPVPTQLLTGNYQGGKKKIHAVKAKKDSKPKAKRGKSAWNLFVEKMMKQSGGTMKETLKMIKEKDMWKK